MTDTVVPDPQTDTASGRRVECALKPGGAPGPGSLSRQCAVSMWAPTMDDPRMALHQASGRWRLGLLLSLAAGLCWATLPIALKVALERVDAVTLTWFRFAGSAVFTFLWLAATGRLGGWGGLSGRHRGMLALASVMLLGNYLFFMFGVERTTPANAQLVIQLAPLLMALGAIRVFGERFGPTQWLGLAVLIVGMWLFFDDQRRHAGGAGYSVGVALVALSAMAWAVYALLQKQLLVRLDPMRILLVIYIAASLLLLPFSRPASLLELDAPHWIATAFCALNTIGAYAAFAAALAHWEASRVSAILATTPLLCIASVAAAHLLWPGFVAPERIAPIGYVGAGLVIAGSLIVSLLGARRRAAGRTDAVAVETAPVEVDPSRA